MLTERQVQRFWGRVIKTEGCWEWVGARNHHGYGVVAISGRMKRAHRVSFAISVGTIPDGLNVLHACDNPPCVRPDHLRVGSQKDNMRDASAKKRIVSPLSGQVQIGSINRNAKLTEAIVAAIKKDIADGRLLKDIAREHGVSRSNISQIKRGSSWAHVK